MAQVELEIGGRQYKLACRDGEEDHLRRIADMVDRKCSDAAESMGGLNEARQLLFASLLLADELNDARIPPNGKQPAKSAPPSDAALAAAIERLAERMESLADRLEA